MSLKDCSQQTSKLIAKFGDLGSFVKKFNPSYQREICEKKDECFFGNYPTLAELKAAYGTNAPMIWLVPQLYNLSEYCGCKDKLTENQLEECAYIIASEYYYLKVSELMLWLHRFKAGKYGRFFGAVDPMIIVASLSDFLRDRNVAIEKHDSELRKIQQEIERSKAISFEEYCKRNGMEGRENPLNNLIEKQV